MEKVTYKIVLDAKKGGNQQRLNGFYYGENGTREIEVVLIKDSELFHVDSENTVIVYGEKADGSTFMQSCEIRNSNIVFTPLSSIFSVSGDVSCQLQILDSDGKILFSPSFTIEVCDTVRDEEAIESSDELSYLDEVIQDVEALRILSGADTDVLSNISEEDGILTLYGERVDKQANDKIESLDEKMSAAEADITALQEGQTENRESISNLDDRLTLLDENVAEEISDVKSEMEVLRFENHSHDNRETLDKLGGDTSRLTYNGYGIPTLHTYTISPIIHDQPNPFDVGYDRGSGDLLYIMSDECGMTGTVLPLQPPSPYAPAPTIEINAGELYFCSGRDWHLILKHTWTDDLLGGSAPVISSGKISAYENDMGYVEQSNFDYELEQAKYYIKDEVNGELREEFLSKEEFDEVIGVLDEFIMRL